MSSLTIFLVCVVLGLCGCSHATHSEQVDSENARSTHDDNSRSTEMHLSRSGTYSCRVVLVNLGSMQIDYRLSDDALIKSLVLDPLGSAKRDDRPAFYEILGTLTVESAGEEIDHVTLFLPLGHFRRQDSYLIADFTKLGQHLTSLLKMEQDFLQTKGSVHSSELKTDSPSEDGRQQ